MDHFSTSENWQPGAVPGEASSSEPRRALDMSTSRLYQQQMRQIQLQMKRGAERQTPHPPPASRPSGHLSSRGKLTMESLAAFEEWQKKTVPPAGDDDPGSDDTAVARAGKTMSDDFHEVFPEDSFSEIHDTRDVPLGGTGGTVPTGGNWMQRASELFPTPRDFHKSIKTWTTTIEPTPALSASDQEKWIKYDAEPDPLSRALIHPPQAPEMRIDPTLISLGPDSRRLTQTANSSCLRHNLMLQTQAAQAEAVVEAQAQAQTQADGSAPQRLDKQKGVDKADRSPSPDRRRSQVPKTTGEDKYKKPSMAVLPDKVAAARCGASIPVTKSVPVRPVAAAPTPVPSTSSIAIRIASAKESHLDQALDIYNKEGFAGGPVAAEGVHRFYTACQQFKLPFLVALSDDQDGEHVLGIALLQPRPMVGVSEPQDMYCADCTILVRIKYRNRGIGHELLSALIMAVTGQQVPQAKAVKADDATSVACLGPRFTFVRDTEAIPPQLAFQPLIHYIIIDIACGSVDGLAEQLYLDKLTAKFDFEYGGLFDDVLWKKDGPVHVKKMLFYRRCRSVENVGQVEAYTVSDVELPVGGPVGGLVQSPPTQSAEMEVADFTQTFGPAMVSLPVRNMSPSRDNARFLPQRLLHGLIAVPATTAGGGKYGNGSGGGSGAGNGNGNMRRAPAGPASAVKSAALMAAEAAAAASFW